MTLTKENLDRKWRLIAKTILNIGRPCTICEIASYIEKTPLSNESWKVGNWRDLAKGAEKLGYIKIKRNCKPFKYSIPEYGFNKDKA
jgi:hypothetical protein